MNVAVIIPIYQATLSELELRSLKQAYTVLGSHPLIIIKPVSLDLSGLLEQFPKLAVETFNDNYFKGIAGYNKLMLSTELYERFRSFTYMLIYQLDAYVFRDELQAWCSKGYDYIGAPWLKKPVYDRPVISGIMRLIRWHCQRTNQPTKQALYNKIGNGGLSLRKVESHYQATLTYQKKIAFYLSRERCHFYNEDVFWATEVPEFAYPQATEALRFAFDKYPSYCYKLTGRQLPFGCHSWYKRKMKKFWKPIINF